MEEIFTRSDVVAALRARPQPFPHQPRDAILLRMTRCAATLILLVLSLGQGLSWICVGSTSTGGSPPSTVAVVAGESPVSDPGSHHGSSSHRGSEHGGHHGAEEGNCDAIMACGMAGATMSGLAALEALVAAHGGAPEPDLLLQLGHSAQDPPPPRLG